MLSRIYYADSSCTTFETVVVRSFEHDGRPAVVLERTAFYPTSGGQPFDTGRLGGIRVLDVVDEGDEIVHVTESRLEQGARVTGEIDVARRLDHMQQHTGQHVLSAAFARLLDNRTVSFHMGEEVCTIDVEKESSPADLARAVAEANRIVWDNRPVSIRFVSAEEASRLPLRKEPARAGALRLIEIEDFDLSACGGTHVARTGAIGIIALLNTERLRGGMRLTFVCGGRALKAIERYRDAVAGSVRILSVLPRELPAAVERLHLEARGLQKSVVRLEERLAVFEAERLLLRAETVAGIRVIVEAVEATDTAVLKTMASALTRHESVMAVVIADASPASIAIARSGDVKLDAARLLKALLASFGGRGGGKPELAQGGGLTAPARDIAAAAREHIARELNGQK